MCFETTQAFPLCFLEKGGEGGSKLRKFMTEIHKIFFKIFFVFQELLKKYSRLTLRRCNKLDNKI